jgi:hypothetical protein
VPFGIRHLHCHARKGIGGANDRFGKEEARAWRQGGGVGVDLLDEETRKSGHILHIVKPKAARHLAVSTIRCI